MTQHEDHKVHRVGWLRAAVLGANDGIVSTASLIVGVAAANVPHEDILIAGVAGLVAGAMSMAAGEYVSVSSQADTEQADLAQEQQSLEQNYEFELEELASIYIGRGLDAKLAKQVAEQLMAHDAIGAHARDEIGISVTTTAKPVEAALSSASAFVLGAAFPLLAAWLAPGAWLIQIVALTSVAILSLLGGLAARAGGASIVRGAVRVAFWGVLAMGITAGVGSFFGVSG